MTAAQFARYQRAEAAQQNGFENVGIYAAAIVAANVAKVPASTCNTAAAIYLASRVVYNMLYINTEKLSTSNLRTVAFLLGVGTYVSCLSLSYSCKDQRKTDDCL